MAQQSCKNTIGRSFDIKETIFMTDILYTLKKVGKSKHFSYPDYFAYLVSPSGIRGPDKLRLHCMYMYMHSFVQLKLPMDYRINLDIHSF